MTHRVNFIHEINASRDTWKLKVRIIGLWRVSRSSTPSIEMIFMDEKGDKIQAIVKKYHIAQWEPQLQEGKSYIAENFDIVLNEGRYRSSNHSFKLIFQKGTIMKNKELPEIPLYIYKFTTFEDILNGVVTSDVLVDVIGEFVDIEMSQPESTPKKVVFIMRDQRGNRISCTLWGQFATQLLKYEEDHKLDPIVVILTLAKIKEARGCHPVTIQNAMYSSKLYINDNNIPEIQYFTSSMSQSSSCSQGGLQDKFFYNATVKTIGEIIHVCEESVSLTYGTIDKLFSNGWYYEGCPHCNQKTDTISIPGNCVGCGKYLDDVVARYRIEVRVSYGHDSMKFVLWNREFYLLLNREIVAFIFTFKGENVISYI
ncbi:PREDICTED: uncharacterized protein LOC109325982 [Lupinus angustifolius]|uniref:uncharacterized protein LOC109325982 n=1 Tax=Lupinus angustifolius TaxID=3871 RepID=UPI00092F68B6|nr:PREDICTED: uncharacterized protein LOC109325982 [Lupinus angustifolius]